jgi:hypothetical protein
MRDLIREEYSFGANPGAKDLARHLYTRMNCGKAVIVASNSNILLPSLRKQWLKLMRKVQKERASTLNAGRICELSEVVIRMQNLRFSTSWPPDGYKPADVYITTVDELLRWAPEAECRTIYTTCETKLEELYKITAWMPKGALVVSVDKQLNGSS